MDWVRTTLLLTSVLFIHHGEAAFQLRASTPEEIQQMRMHMHRVPESGPVDIQLDKAENTKLFKALEIDWWFLARNTAMSILISVTLVVGLCTCIKFGEGKQAEHWGQWAARNADPEEKEKWDTIEERMQTTDVASCVEATDYQQMLKNVATQVRTDKSNAKSQVGALRSFVARSFAKFHINDMNNAAGAVLHGMPAPEAMHWLQLQPKPFQSNIK